MDLDSFEGIYDIVVIFDFEVFLGGVCFRGVVIVGHHPNCTSE